MTTAQDTWSDWYMFRVAFHRLTLFIAGKRRAKWNIHALFLEFVFFVKYNFLVMYDIWGRILWHLFDLATQKNLCDKLKESFPSTHCSNTKQYKNYSS